MNGVEILSSQTIYDTMLPSWVTGISLIVFVMSFTLCILFVTDSHKAGTIIFLLLAVVSIVLLVLSLMPSDTDIKHIEYKVNVDDSVSMNEFLDKYEIIDQEGELYTVKEKNNE